MLYMDWERFKDTSLSVRGGIPILFPICGNLPDNRYDWEGQSYSLKQHGFARDLPWTVIEQFGHTVSLQLSDSPQTQAVYPFPFVATLTYRLDETALEVSFKLQNPGDRPLPFCFGLHPYFLLFDKAHAAVEIPCSRYQDQKTGQWFSFQGELEWTQPELDLAFRELRANSASVTDRQRRLRLQLDFDPAFGTFVFWTLLDKNFVCLEPWTAPRNALTSGDGLLLLPSGAEQVLSVHFQVEYL
jgi:galactose mutarotase-like enzyme